MKNILKIILFISSFLIFSKIFAVDVNMYPNFISEKNYLESANYLAEQKIIVNNSENPEKYNINSNILRQEIAWIILKASKIETNSKCEWIFSDVKITSSNSWACPTIEALARENIVAKNPTYRPTSSVSKAEWLAFIVNTYFEAEYFIFRSTKGRDKKSWEENIVEFAKQNKILREEIGNYKDPATRWFIFKTMYYADVLNNILLSENDFSYFFENF